MDYKFGKTKNSQVLLYYDVPYKDKEEAKKINMRWDLQRKQWFKIVDNDVDKVFDELNKDFDKWEFVDCFGLIGYDDRILEFYKKNLRD